MIPLLCNPPQVTMLQLLVLLLPLVPPLLASCPGPICPTPIDGSYYEMFSDVLTNWPDARFFCETQGKDVAGE